MDVWLAEHLVCPRDHCKLQLDDNDLVCPEGHHYPYLDDIPIMLLEDARPTHESHDDTLEQVDSQRPPVISEGTFSTVDQNTVDPYVQQGIVDSCGNCYIPLLGKLPRYPIPDIPLSPGTGQRLLDIGCNWGRWCISASRKGYAPVGIDPSLKAIRAARRVARQLGVSATFVVGDARYLPFAPQAFDVVYSYSVLQHFDKSDVKLTLSEIARVLTESGTSLIQMPTFFGPRNLYSQLRRGFRNPTDFEVRYWTLAELKDTWCELVGPSNLSVEGFFGTAIGANENNIDLLPRRYRFLVRCSKALRRMSHQLPWMTHVADSLFIQSTRGDSLRGNDA